MASSLTKNIRSMPLTADQKKDFYRRMLVIAVPMMIQNLLASSISFLDTLMIGQLGETEIAAVGLGNQMFFLINLIYFGTVSGASIFISQFWGAGNRENIQKVMGIAIILGVVSSIFFSLASILAPVQVMHIFTSDPDVVAKGVEYLQAVGISYVFAAISSVYAATLRSTGDSTTPLIFSVSALVFNALFNWLLIFGVGFFPRMEVQGAALATTGARLLEMCGLFIYAQKKKTPAAITSFKTAFSIDKVFFKTFMKTCFPVILNEFFWALGVTAYKVAYSRMGVDVIASVNVSESIQNFFFVAIMGIANATAILIGIRIGEGQSGLARSYAKKCTQLSFFLGIFFGLLMFFLAPLIPRFFNVSEHVANLTRLSLMSMSLLLPFKFTNTTIIVGILRGGGDTKFSLLTEMSGVWGIGVPCAFIGGLLIGMPIYWLYLFVGLEEVFKTCMGYLRVRSGRWLNDLSGTKTEPVQT